MPRVVITAGLEFEHALFDRGISLIAGLDEAGRGAWAGPVAAAAVILPLNRPDLPDLLAGVTDSKRLSPERRDALAPLIKEVALAWAVGRCTNREIDEIGIVAATKMAMARALIKLDMRPEHLLIDALDLDETVFPRSQQSSIIKGDQRSLSIAAASILAKVTRDRFMEALDEQYPEYGFASHKGYGTGEHLTALGAHGPCRAHRHSFKPIMAWKRLL